jgi:hypothetical protein
LERSTLEQLERSTLEQLERPSSWNGNVACDARRFYLPSNLVCHHASTASRSHIPR